MLLAVDIGNSHVTIGLRDHSAWRARWRLGAVPDRTVDEYSVALRALLQAEGLSADNISGAVLCSVVPSLTARFAAICSELDAAPLIVGPGLQTGLEIAYHPRRSLGADRVVTALAATELAGAPVVVVDCGTATTFGVVDSDRRFLGGAIAPGLGTAAHALIDTGARLLDVDFSTSPPDTTYGRTTEASLRSGVVLGHAQLIAGLLQRIETELADAGQQQRPTVVATGGWSPTVASHVSRIDRMEPDLLLEGLDMLYRRRASTGLKQSLPPAFPARRRSNHAVDPAGSE